jgi:ketosteroid isomerase-like protein
MTCVKPAAATASLGGGRVAAYPLAATAGETAMTDSDAVLAANLEFYQAFTMRDLVAMEALWARQAPVSCIHPGWPPLAGRDAVMESWQGILANPDAPKIACYDERVSLYGETALVLCEEELAGGTLVASNLFVREDGAWKIAHHHAGQLVTRRRPRQRTPPPPRSRFN